MTRHGGWRGSVCRAVCAQRIVRPLTRPGVDSVQTRHGDGGNAAEPCNRQEPLRAENAATRFKRTRKLGMPNAGAAQAVARTAREERVGRRGESATALFTREMAAKRAATTLCRARVIAVRQVYTFASHGRRAWSSVAGGGNAKGGGSGGGQKRGSQHRSRV